jgi:hypothetical protein
VAPKKENRKEEEERPEDRHVTSCKRPAPDVAPPPCTRTMSQNKALFFITYPVYGILLLPTEN